MRRTAWSLELPVKRCDSSTRSVDRGRQILRYPSGVNLLDTDLGRFRLVSLLEGFSYLGLLGIAMPLKYVAGNAGAVRVAGMIHGVLFLLFCAALFSVATNRDWKLKQIAIAFIASLVPFGAFWLEHRLRHQAQA